MCTTHIITHISIISWASSSSHEHILLSLHWYIDRYYNHSVECSPSSSTYFDLYDGCWSLYLDVCPTRLSTITRNSLSAASVGNPGWFYAYTRIFIHRDTPNFVFHSSNPSPDLPFIWLLRGLCRSEFTIICPFNQFSSLLI